MTPHFVLLTLHVVIAVLGIGPTLALAWIASDAARRHQPGDARYLELFSRYLQYALSLMFITGVLLLRDTGWAYWPTTWMRISFALFIVLGAVLGLANRPLRQATTPPTPAVLTRFARIAWSCCAIVAALVFLMVTKPA